MRRIAFAALYTICFGALAFTAGCGPGLIALGGGGSGAWFGLAGGDDDKKKSTEPPVQGPNVAPAVIVTALVREESPARIQYTLIDANADVCSVQVEFAEGAGPFTSCLQGAGGDGITGLTSSAGGTNHVFRWDFQTDLGPQRSTNISIRIRANDGAQFGSWFTLSSQSIGNDGPDIDNVNILGTSGVVLVTFDLLDQNSDLGSFEMEWSIDSGLNFTPVVPSSEIVGNPPVGLLTSPTGSPGQIVWNTSVALGNYVGEFYLRFFPYDQPTGYGSPTPGVPVVIGPFVLDNAVNQPPVLELARLYSGQQFVSKVPLDFTLADGESDAAAVIVAYSVSGGSAQLATLTQQFGAGTAGPFPTTPSPTFYGVTWDALADLKNEPGILTTGVPVNVILIPADAQSGTPVITAQFTVFGNSAPEVASISVLNTFGNVPVVVRLVDASGDPVSVSVSYSTDGNNFSPLSQSDFPFGSLSGMSSSPSGVDNALVWNTALVFNGAGANQPTVYLRVTPTDHPVSGTPTADMTGQFFDSNPFPIINNPSGAAPVSISLFTVSTPGATTPSSPQHVTVVPGGTPPANQRHFNRVINPSSAVGFETFFAVFDGPGYGTLLDDLGNPLNYATATLTMEDPSAIFSGDTITIGDGFNTPVTFEFYNGGVQTFPNPNTVVNIVGAANADDVAALFFAELDSAFGSNFLLLASVAGDTVTLTHFIACNSGNAASHGGFAPDMAFSNPGVVTSYTDLAGGAAPTNGVTFVAPSTAPGASESVTIKCEIDHPSFFNVKSFHQLYWGPTPTSVSIAPNPATVMLNGAQNFGATVFPGGAPQQVTWEVVGSGNGSFSSNGLYRAPATMPASSSITIKATSVQSGIFGIATVNLVPEPTSIDVTSQGGATTLVLSGGTASTLQFFSQVNPTGAPQGVNWRIIHGGFDHGGGGATVGTISMGGLYTAPNMLISPPQVQIQAVSLVNSAVYGSFNLTLVAPAPTSFAVSPASVTIFSGGIGQQFDAVNFVPTNANPAVTWELIPSSGFGTISSSGYYTPPFNVAAATNVTARARSAVQSTVFADAIIDLRPNASATPTSVNLTPEQAITSVVGPQVTFVATVAPGSAPQNITWSIVGGAPKGSVDATGKYTPGTSTTDYTETIRATATGFPTVFDESVVYVSGSGHSVTDRQDVVVGRADATPIWDGINQRLWLIGGQSEATRPDHELQVRYYDVGADILMQGPTISGAGGAFSSQPRSVQAALDPVSSRIFVVCGMGTAAAPRVFQLSLSTPTAWSEFVSPGGGGNIPFMISNQRYPLWYDTTDNLLYLMQDKAEAHRFNPATNQWISRVSWSQQTFGPNAILNNAFVWRQANRELVCIGPQSDFSGSAHRVHVLEVTLNRWAVRTAVGTPPSTGIAEAGLFFSSTTGSYFMYGGRDVGTSTFNEDMREVVITSITATWTTVALAAPQPERRARMLMSDTNAGTGPICYGGRNGRGVFGDIWNFDPSSKTFQRATPGGLLPQGRKFAVGGWMNGQGFVVGGECDHGTSDEMWNVTMSGGVPQWSLRNTTGAKPPKVCSASVAMDPAGNRFFLFGGSDLAGGSKGSSVNNDLYQFVSTTNTWSVITPSGTPPSARFGAAMCPVFTIGGSLKELWIFGGEGVSGKLNDLHKLDLSSGLPGTWSVVAQASPPDAREGATMGWDSRRNFLLLVGGDSTISGPNRQYFEFSISSGIWQARTVGNTGSEENVHITGAVYDDLHRRFLHGPFDKTKNQALVVATGTPGWQYMISPTTEHHSASVGLFDPATGRYWVVSGDRTTSGNKIGTNAVRTFRLK